ncbi:MAG: fasciclin domain-containing protein [Deinococcota bacterium]
MHHFMTRFIVVRSLQIMILTALTVSVLASCDEANGGEVGRSVYDHIVGESDLSTLEDAINLVDLLDQFAFDNPEGRDYTIFAPTDEAFEAFLQSQGASELDQLDPEVLSDVLKYHIVRDSLDSEDLIDSSDVITVQGSSVSLSGDDVESLEVNNINLTSDIDNSLDNGYVHEIDGVLVPPSD